MQLCKLPAKSLDRMWGLWGLKGSPVARIPGICGGNEACWESPAYFSHIGRRPPWLWADPCWWECGRGKMPHSPLYGFPYSIEILPFPWCSPAYNCSHCSWNIVVYFLFGPLFIGGNKYQVTLVSQLAGITLKIYQNLLPLIFIELIFSQSSQLSNSTSINSTHERQLLSQY